MHPLVCTAFNADFDGDQMAVHVPLGHAAVLEASTVDAFFSQHFEPCKWSSITVPSQDMVLGLYYVTKGRRSTDDHKVDGEGMRFYSSEEVLIAMNEGDFLSTLTFK